MPLRRRVIQQLLAILDKVQLVGQPVLLPGVFHEHAVFGVVVGVQDGDGLSESIHVGCLLAYLWPNSPDASVRMMNLAPAPGVLLRRDGAAVPVHDLAADSEANAGSFVLVAPVQALKDLKDAVAILFVEADAVVFHRDLPAGRAAGER